MPKVKLFDQEQALDNAMNLFWTKGYNGTSINDLVKATGLSRSSLYDTFQDKHQLYKATLKHYQAQQMKGLSAVLDKQPDSKKKIEVLFAFFLNQIITQPKGQGCFMINTAAEMLNQDKELAKFAKEDFVGMEQLFLSIIKEGQRKNEIAKTHKPELLAHSLFSSYLGFRIAGQAEPDKKRLTQIIALVLEAI